MNDKDYQEELQKIANEHGSKVYRYELENGNRFSTVQPAFKGEKIGGSKVKKLIEVIKPEKKKKS